MSLFSYVLVTIVLSYAMIRIYMDLHVNFQICKTERMAEHWVIGLSVLEKLIQYTFMEYHLCFQE